MDEPQVLYADKPDPETFYILCDFIYLTFQNRQNSQDRKTDQWFSGLDVGGVSYKGHQKILGGDQTVLQFDSGVHFFGSEPRLDFTVHKLLINFFFNGKDYFQIWC